MNKDDQIRIATDYARRQGIAVEKYKVLSVQSDKGSAHVLFHNDSGPPGDHFTVVVDLGSRQATRLVPGE